MIFLVIAAVGALLVFYKLWAAVPSEQKYEKFSAVSSFFTLAVAFSAAFVAYDQLNESKLASAKSIYKDYISLAFANPNFSAASYPIESPKFESFKPGSEEYEKYEYFVGFLLYSVESILPLVGDDENWYSTLSDQLMYHALYLKSGKANIENYSPQIDSIVNEAIRRYEEEALEKRVQPS